MSEAMPRQQQPNAFVDKHRAMVLANVTVKSLAAIAEGQVGYTLEVGRLTAKPNRYPIFF